MCSFRGVSCPASVPGWEDAGMAEWISGVCAVLSLVGAGFAWWRSNLSAKAKREAEQQAQLAARKIEAAEQQAAKLSEQVAELRKMRDLLQGPPLEMFAIGENRWHLTNKRDEPVVIEEIVNEDDFVRIRIGAMELAPYGATEVVALGALSKPLPTTLLLRITSRPDPLHVRIPRF